jgi:diguanylate cyclase (GGDEF)-like protein
LVFKNPESTLTRKLLKHSKKYFHETIPYFSLIRKFFSLPVWTAFSKLTIIIIVIIAVITIGIFDYLITPGISLSILYFFPIAFVSWFAYRRSGIVIVVRSTMSWLFCSENLENFFHNPINLWNNLSGIVSFMLIAFLFAALRRSYDHEKNHSQIDHLTEVYNRRAFDEFLTSELSRALRHPRPTTLLFMDIDNFKVLNDLLGHMTGDMVLKTVAQTLKNSFRSSDVIARWGGDEFCVLLPETNANGSREIVDRMHKLLLEKMNENNWQITFSIGVLTCNHPPKTMEDFLKRVDELTYKIKQDGKNAVLYDTHNC